MSTATSPPSDPSAASDTGGYLRDQALAALLVEATDFAFEGRLTLTEPSGERHVFVLGQGGILAVESRMGPTLVGLLVAQGALDAARLGALEGLLGEDETRQAELLAASGVVTEAALRLARSEQTLARAQAVAAQVSPACAWTLERGVERHASARPVDPLPVIWAALAHNGPHPALAAELDALGSTFLRVRPDAPIERFRFAPTERSAIDTLARSTASYRELAAQSHVWPSLIGVLVLTRSLERRGVTEPPVGTATRMMPREAAGSALAGETYGRRRPSDERESAALPVVGHGHHPQRYLWLVLGLAPLAFSLARDSNDLVERLTETASHNSALRALLERDDFTADELFATLPDGKIDGALVAHGSVLPWLFALVAAGLMLAAVLGLFERDSVRVRTLGASLAFTATAGILLLFGIQLAAEYSRGVWVHTGGIGMVILYLVKAIGFSYRAALDPDNGFVVSLIGFTFGVGLCEELVKALPVWFRLRRHPELGARDACLWGLASGIGFGVAEGVIYARSMYDGLETGGTYVLRFVSCVTLHALWSGMSALVMHRHRDALRGGRQLAEWALVALRVLAVPMLLHGLYDTLLKRDLAGVALLTAVASFGCLAFLVERMRRESYA